MCPLPQALPPFLLTEHDLEVQNLPGHCSGYTQGHHGQSEDVVKRVWACLGLFGPHSKSALEGELPLSMAPVGDSPCAQMGAREASPEGATAATARIPVLAPLPLWTPLTG